MTLQELKSNVAELPFNKEAFTTISKYNKEFQSRHGCSLMHLSIDKHKPAYMLMTHSWDLDDEIKVRLRDGHNLEILKEKLTRLIVDLIAFLDDRNLPDKGADDLLKEQSPFS